MALSLQAWPLVSPYLDKALEMDAAERVRWLADLQGADPELAALVQTVLEESDAVSRERFLEDACSSYLPRGSLAGRTIGAYRLLALIGEGGMGAVWLAERADGRFEGQAAIKLLNPMLVGHPGEKRFTREGAILARLTHPHIARLLDAGVSPGGQPFLVLEYVAGVTIDQYCDEHRLSVEARIRLFLDVVAAVAQAHANLIVHRDLKPSNVLVTADGHVKLLDFGIAKLLENDESPTPAALVTHDGRWAMTPAYAAPEQVTGGTITTATDVYALGVLLYVLLSGRHPAGAAMRSPAELASAILDTPPASLADATAVDGAPTAAHIAARRGVSPERLRRSLRGDLNTIVSKALRKSPADRYASVAAFAEDLRRYLHHEPISVRQDAFAYRTSRFLRRHLRAVAAGVLIGLLLTVLVGFYTVRLADERDRAQHAAASAAKASEVLAGLLTSADPYRTPDRTEPTVRGLLDAAAERLPGELADQPDLQAAMLTVMGRTYRRLGAYEKADALLRDALAIGRRVFGPGHERVAHSLHDLGVLLAERGDYDEAGSSLEHALRLRRQLLGAGHPEVAVTLVELGRVYQDRGFNDRAEPLQREALDIRRTALGPAHRETATSLSDLASVLRLKGDLSGAETLLRQCLAINRKVLGDEHPNMSTPLNDLGLIAGTRGDYLAAETLFRQALALGRRTLGEHHPINATTLNNLARALTQQGRHDDATSALLEALQIARPALGSDHALVAILRINLARLHLARANGRSAEPLLRDALEVRRRAPGIVPSRRRLFPDDDRGVEEVRSLLAAALAAQRRRP